MRDIDLTALLGNLLENAVCGNTCLDDLKLSGSLPAGKSIGISSILSVCQRYDGNLDYKVENGICSARVILAVSI